MTATAVEAVEFGWGPALLERALEDEVSLVGAVQLAEALTSRLPYDAAGLDGDARVDLLRVWERLEAMVAGRKQLALAAVVDATADLGLAPEDARHEVAAALRLAPVTAADRTRVAVELRDRLPATLPLLCPGEIGWRQAANVADGVPRPARPGGARGGGRGCWTGCRSRPRPRPAGRSPTPWSRVDPAAAAARAEKAQGERRIERLTQPDAMASWWFPVPADVEHAMWSAATARANAVKAARAAAGLDDIGLDALRVDVVRDAIAGPRPDARRRRLTAPVVQAGTPPAEVLVRREAGRRGRHGPAHRSGLANNPGRVPGYGSVPGPMARAMAADRDWVRWTVDPGTRQVIDRGADTYRPSERMRAFLAARDRTCGFPGCHRRAQECDCDHVSATACPTARPSPSTSARCAASTTTPRPTAAGG